jgi:hypothetical protein
MDLGSGNQIEFMDPTEQVARFHLRILKMKGGGPFVLKIHEISTAEVRWQFTPIILERQHKLTFQPFTNFTTECSFTLHSHVTCGPGQTTPRRSYRVYPSFR